MTYTEMLTDSGLYLFFFSFGLVSGMFIFDIQGVLKIQGHDITGSDVKELKMMLDFLRHVIATDTHMSELWVAYKAKEKILR